MFTQADLEQMKNRGMSPKTIEQQIENFIQGFPFINLDRPATNPDGIQVFQDEEVKILSENYLNQIEGKKILKFVPASGAASRMFKQLFDFQEKCFKNPVSLNDLFHDKGFSSPYKFFRDIHNFAFFPELERTLQQHGFNIGSELSHRDYCLILDFLLSDKGMNYANLPKGLLTFHAHGNTSRTSLEEHLVEAAGYAKNSSNEVHLHFTVSPEHLERFKDKINAILYIYEKTFNVKYHISYSVQKLSTDTIAVTKENDLFRDEEGKLLFRPGGHGALIENLAELDADLIFIKNIDNVVPDKLKEHTYLYKKVIGGYLLQLQQQIFDYLNRLSENIYSEELITEITGFASSKLFFQFPENFAGMSLVEKHAFLFSKLNRPIRVCGMVKNEGEPGGGPYWVRNANNETSLQIVESSQVNTKDKVQDQIFRCATHFNPVDLVCAIKNYRGEKFDLKAFVDPGTGFISEKSKDGKILKAQELPGLWNGAMADWTSVFVEVPIITFNPVKVVNDLLRNEHQG